MLDSKIKKLNNFFNHYFFEKNNKFKSDNKNQKIFKPDLSFGSRGKKNA